MHQPVRFSGITFRMVPVRYCPTWTLWLSAPIWPLSSHNPWPFCQMRSARPVFAKSATRNLKVNAYQKLQNQTTLQYSQDLLSFWGLANFGSEAFRFIHPVLKLGLYNLGLLTTLRAIFKFWLEYLQHLGVLTLGDRAIFRARVSGAAPVVTSNVQRKVMSWWPSYLGVVVWQIN